jgi:glycosyltransferase involved in cell wall biosynthesis
MRVALISEHASPLAAIGGVDAGGQNRHVAELAAALARRGHAVTVYTRRDSVDAPGRVRVEGFDVVHVPAGPAVALEKDKLLPYMDEFGWWLGQRWRVDEPAPDVIHAHFWMSGVAAMRAAGARIPVLLTYHALGAVKRRHQADADTSPPERLGVEARLGQQVDGVIAQCADEVAELVRMGVPIERITVIASGVDIDKFCPDGPRAPGTPGLARILTAGRMVPRKGFDDLIRAVALLPETELVVLGGAGAAAGDPEGRRLLHLAEQLNAGARVHLPGSVPSDEMPQWYRSAAVAACTPWYEPFGLTPLEAMACGVPVVTYPVGGLGESVVDGLTGLHVPPGDIAVLAGALARVCTDDDLRGRLSRAAYQRAQTRYSWDLAASRLAEAYASVAVRRIEPQEVVS